MRRAVTVRVKRTNRATANRLKAILEDFDLLLQEINLAGLLNDDVIQLLKGIFLEQNAALKIFDQILEMIDFVLGHTHTLGSHDFNGATV